MASLLFLDFSTKQISSVASSGQPGSLEKKTERDNLHAVKQIIVVEARMYRKMALLDDEASNTYQ